MLLIKNSVDAINFDKKQIMIGRWLRSNNKEISNLAGCFRSVIVSTFEKKRWMNMNQEIQSCWTPTPNQLNVDVRSFLYQKNRRKICLWLSWKFNIMQTNMYKYFIMYKYFLKHRVSKLFRM